MRNVGGAHLILSTGGILREAMDAANRLAEKGVAVDVFNLRFLKPLDTSFYLDLLENYESAVLVEDEAETGGIGEMLLSKVAESAAAGGAPTANLSIRGIPETFDARGTREELLSLCRLDAAGISEMILQGHIVKRFYRLSKRRP